ncbi:MAG TPA: hypothetical protein PLO53_14965, partial [Candidatus Hydrogenedentes bacterium]|nr:hypothetical protein [Candidatus Hydrogenedentota bacterium]
YALKIWWLQNAQAAFSVGPQGVVVRSPRFEWRMNRPFNFAADEIFPCYPIARYKLWASVDAGLPAAQTRWDALSDWSPWTSGPIELDASELDRLRNDPNLQGRMILICIAGGDEAGNLQPGGAADGAQLTSLADLEASGIDYRWWINGDARMQMSIDTDAQVSLMWRPAGQGTAPVRTFGAARKIPAPKPDLGLVPDADITLRALLPSRAANVDATAAPSQTVIYWTLFRNGRPIKADTALYTDTATPDANGVITFRLSEALQALFDGGLAIADPNAVFNVGNREVRFAITAFAESLIPDATGGLVSVKDATPVTVEFSIYPPEMYEGIRDERPTRIYNRQ